MKELKSVNNLNRNNYSGIFAVFSFLILPFIFSPFLQDQDFFPKNIAINSVSILLLIRLLFKKEEIRINKSAFLYFLVSIGFILSMLISFHRIINSEEGLASLLYFVSFFIFTFSIVANEKLINQSKFAVLSCYTIFLISFIVLLQIIYKAITEQQFQIDYSIRATLSNKNFVSEILLLLLPFSVIGIFTDLTRQKKLAIVATVVSLLFLVLLKTLSIWIAAVLTTLIFAPVYKLFFRKSSKWGFSKKQLIILSVVSVFIIGLAGIGFLKPIKSKVEAVSHLLNADFGKQISEDDSSNLNSVFERALLWRNSFDLASEHPLDGIGLSNWKVMYPKYGIGGAHHLNSGVMHYEHPHNEYFLILAETGIVSLVFFLSIFICVIVLGGNKIRSENGKPVFFMLCGIFCFLILSFLGYPLHRPYAFFLVTIMLVVVLQESKESKSVSVSRILILIFLLVNIFSLRVLLARQSGSLHINNALSFQSRGRFENMLKEVRLAENDYYQLDNTVTPLNWYKGFAHYYMGTDSSLYYFELAEKLNPYHVQVLSDIGASLENKGEHEKAISYLNRAIAITPRFKQARLNLAIAYFNTDKIDDAFASINQITITGENAYELKVLQTILTSHVMRKAERSKDLQEKQCLTELILDKKKLVKLFEEGFDQKGVFDSLLTKYCK